MKQSRRELGVESRGLDAAGLRPSAFDVRLRRAFTLIEIMVVVSIIGLIMAVGVPTLYHAIKREGISKVTNDLMETCANARGRAILSGSEVTVVFQPLNRRFEVSGGGGPTDPNQASATTGQIPDSIQIEMLDVNLLEYRESDSVRVRFFPNGTSDEMTLILHSDKDEWRKFTLEVTTGLASVTDKIQ
ncbi:MAG: type II secretion system protein [Verrucomicrobia bacterium]|nr:MAG: type II secretion system protein [Verrucomicrobiota bacterium]